MVRRHGLLVALVVALTTFPLQVHAERSTNGDYTNHTIVEEASRIVGGQEVESAKIFPWQVYVKGYKIGSTSSYGLCGGSLISLGWVMSAAHCVTKEDEDDEHMFHIDVERIELYAGVYDRKDLDDNDVQADILVEDDFEEHVFIHPDYKKVYRHNNDITIFKLNKQFTLTDTVKPIDLATSNDFYPGKTLIVSGWGRTCDDCDDKPDILHYVSLKLISRSECSDYWGSDRIKDTMICHNTEDKNTCSGDSGGPVITGIGQSDGTPYVQIGIVSFGHSNCDIDAPDVFVDVAKFRDWIKITMENQGSGGGVTSGTCSDYVASSRCYRYYYKGIRKYCLSGERWSQSNCKCISSSSCQHSCSEHTASSKCYRYYFYGNLKFCDIGESWSQADCKCISSSSCKHPDEVAVGDCSDYTASSKCYRYYYNGEKKYCLSGERWSQTNCKCIKSPSCQHSCSEHTASSKCYRYYFYGERMYCLSGERWSQSNCKCISSSSCQHSCSEHTASSKCYKYYFYGNSKYCPSGTRWSQTNCRCISSSSCPGMPLDPKYFSSKSTNLD